MIPYFHPAFTGQKQKNLLLFTFYLTSATAVSSAGSSLILRPRTMYAIGDAMKIEDKVPNTTPRIIANEKLRMLSPTAFPAVRS